MSIRYGVGELLLHFINATRLYRIVTTSEVTWTREGYVMQRSS